MKRAFLCAAVVLALVTVACGGGGGQESASSSSAPAAAPAPAAPSGPSGSVSGKAIYTAEDTDTAVSMDADPQCASFHAEEVLTESVVVDGEGNLANVFVYVKEGASGGTPKGDVLLDQEGCVYKPHVVGVMVGQAMKIRNSDQVLHNVHALPKENTEFNQGQPFADMELEHTFDKAEVMVPVKCDVHPWMKSYIGVVDHPYFAVTAADGSFTIDGLAPGDYVLEAWHEEFGTKTMSVTVAANEAADASFDFTS